MASRYFSAKLKPTMRIKSFSRKQEADIMGPITNYELGKMTHREYEAEASRYWGQETNGDDKPRLSKKHRLALALSGVTMTTVLIVQMLAF
jgi:hypothetical protein